MLLSGLGAPATLTAATEPGDPPVNSDGLHEQPWFHTSFMDMAEDHADAAADGKNLMILVEQYGCPYCRELHRVNFARSEITDFIQENYLVVQLNMWGDREVTDFDGEVMTEKNLCRKWFVSFTPTTIMFNQRDVGATDIRGAEAFRLPGYFKPFHYITALEYGASDQYRDLPFQRFLQARLERLEAQGITPDVW
ncbi:MAG: thioredoxin family protein [Brevirhabdus sp.]